jgi:hypothetical protein
MRVHEPDAPFSPVDNHEPATAPVEKPPFRGAPHALAEAAPHIAAALLAAAPAVPGLVSALEQPVAARRANRAPRGDSGGLHSTRTSLGGGALRSATTLSSVRATPEAIATAVTGDWSVWWRHSAVEKNEPGFRIWPLGIGPKVDIVLGARVAREGGIDIPMTFSGDFTGRGVIRIVSLGNGLSSVTLDWSRFTVTGVVPSRVAVGMHELTLEGRVPGLRGTGLAGLRDLLEAAHGSSR